MRRDQPEGAAATPAEAADSLRDRPLNRRSPRILVLPLRRLLRPPGRPRLRRVVRPFAGPRPVVAAPALRPALDPVSLIPDHDQLGRRAVAYRTGGSDHGLGGGRYASRPPPVRP